MGLGVFNNWLTLDFKYAGSNWTRNHWRGRNRRYNFQTSRAKNGIKKIPSKSAQRSANYGPGTKSSPPPLVFVHKALLGHSPACSVLSVAAFELQRQRWVAATGTRRPTMPYSLALYRKSANPCYGHHTTDKCKSGCGLSLLSTKTKTVFPPLFTATRFNQINNMHERTFVQACSQPTPQLQLHNHPLHMQLAEPDFLKDRKSRPFYSNTERPQATCQPPSYPQW